MGRSDGLAERVKTALQAAFPPPDLVRVEGEDGIIAIVISERFQGMDDFERQDVVWGPLEATLDRRERREIAIVLPVTPKEEAGYSVGSGDSEVHPPTASGAAVVTAPGEVP